MIAILHNIRSIYNVAAIFRTADGLGVGKLYLSGYTPAPVDRFGRPRDKFSKVALGAENTVNYEQTENVSEIIKELKEGGFSIYACEPTDSAKDYRTLTADHEKTCLVFGNEPNGLSSNVLDLVDRVIEIPMQGEKSSFNVSVAFGILLARLGQQ